MKIFCCNCDGEIEARLTDGSEIYPHRSDLYTLPFWICDSCNGFVGCHHKTKDRTRPLGIIPTKEIKQNRKKIHALLDQIWKQGRVRRVDCYKRLSQVIGRQYHTAELKSLSEVDLILKEVVTMRNELGMITIN